MVETKVPTILIVEDDLNIIEFIRQVTRDEPCFEIIFASTAEEAIKLLNISSVDAILLDVKLSDVTGITLGLKIREVLPSIPMVLFTSYEGEEIQRRAKKMNAFYWYKLDIVATPHKLLGCLKKLLEGRSCLDSDIKFNKALTNPEKVGLKISRFLTPAGQRQIRSQNSIK